MIRTVLVPLDGSKAAEAVIPYVELIASRPLLLVRARDRGDGALAIVDRILVPLDGSQVSLSVLPYVEELAEALGASLVLYNAVLPLDIYPGTELTPVRVG